MTAPHSKHRVVIAILIALASFSNISSNAQTLIKYDEKGRFGLKDANDRIHKTAIYYRLDYSKGVWIGIVGDQTIMMDEKGFPLTKEIYDAIDPDPSKPLLRADKEGEIGALNRQGKEVIPCAYSDVKVLDRFVIVRNHRGECGLSDLEHNFVIAPYYLNIELKKHPAIGEYFFLSIGITASSIADANGNILLTKLENAVVDSKLPVVTYAKNKKYGVSDLKGKEMIPFIYKAVARSGDVFKAMKDDGTMETFNDKFQKVK